MPQDGCRGQSGWPRSGVPPALRFG